MTDRGLERLKLDEGLRRKPYTDTVGVLTIGYGRAIGRRGISLAEAEHLLRNDVAEVEAGLRRALPWTARLDDVRRDVLENMAFNLGLAGLLRWRHTLAAVERGDYADAARRMRASKWAGQVRTRAVRLARMMETGARSS